ncbi:unnamed protein product [Rotaria sp. Silwood2]|nr:unnamed protein product [Rotaria sp. Silwood2]
MIHLTESSNKFFHDIPNPFERRHFAFRVLPEEKDPMSRAKNYSFIMSTLKLRLQQLITTNLWEYIMFILSIWLFISLLIVHKTPEMRIFFELTHEITQAALFIEFVYNLFVSDHLGVPQINSIQRLFRTLHAIRLIRIHSLLRFSVFALLSIAFEGDKSFWDSGTYEPYENYTEALYSYYMCITLEGVSEVAEQILQLDSPQFTTVIGLTFYIFAALATHSVGQLLAAVVATTLGKAIDQITRNKSSATSQHYNTKLLGLQRPSINENKISMSRCTNVDEIQNFSQLKPDDLALLIILFQTLDKNIIEYDNILRDIRHIGEYISKSNKKKTSFSAH